MKRPPVLMRIQVRSEQDKFSLWLPLFLLLPLALVLLIALSPLIVIAIVVYRLTAHRRQSPRAVGSVVSVLCSPRAMKAAFDVLCSTPGLRVAITGRNERVNIFII